MKLIETNVSETAVRMRLADNADPAKATQWVELLVPIGSLRIDAINPLGNPQKRHFGSIQRAALNYVQDAISGLAQAIANAQGR